MTITLTKAIMPIICQPTPKICQSKQSNHISIINMFYCK